MWRPVPERPADAPDQVTFDLDGEAVAVPDDGGSLLGALRDHLGRRGPKDGCSPQGQCGCCTVLVDGAPRVACVTPARRVAGRSITTVDGLDPDVRTAWTEALCATGGSQCGFCTPGIVVRAGKLAAMAEIAGVLKTQGFKPELSPEGITKFTRGTARIDLLAPEGMGGDVPTVDAGPRAPDLALPAGLAATPPTGGAR